MEFEEEVKHMNNLVTNYNSYGTIDDKTAEEGDKLFDLIDKKLTDLELRMRKELHERKRRNFAMQQNIIEYKNGNNEITLKNDKLSKEMKEASTNMKTVQDEIGQFDKTPIESSAGPSCSESFTKFADDYRKKLEKIADIQKLNRFQLNGDSRI